MLKFIIIPPKIKQTEMILKWFLKDRIRHFASCISVDSDIHILIYYIGY